ncbi:MAG TPA: hypothetical protein DCO77_08395 [Nitrospiraceae bacterium]|nr:hypothetical protein [Nitrospiraceae bacterium]
MLLPQLGTGRRGKYGKRDLCGADIHNFLFEQLEILDGEIRIYHKACVQRYANVTKDLNRLPVRLYIRAFFVLIQPGTDHCLQPDIDNAQTGLLPEPEQIGIFNDGVTTRPADIFLPDPPLQEKLGNGCHAGFVQKRLVINKIDMVFRYPFYFIDDVLRRPLQVFSVHDMMDNAKGA